MKSFDQVVTSNGFLNAIKSVLVIIFFASWASATDNALSSGRALNTNDEGERVFTLKVLPLLKIKCFGCHGGDEKNIRGDLDVRSRHGLLTGGESGDPSIVPGFPDRSPLFSSILWEGSEMPPKENDRLTKKETDYFSQWIEAGAPWPNAKRQREIQELEWAVRENKDGVIVETSGGTSDDWTYRRYKPGDIWAFKPIQKIAIPVESLEQQISIDSFIDKRLAAAKLDAGALADARTLIRRATYDLTGLPPTPKNISDFVKEFNRSPDDAWSTLIDRLLDSKHYGERWAQHWLDVVRYADTAGFSNDYERSNAWRYRDYVIRSFNSDKPFNDFVIEQIAGDEFKPNDPEALIATGFLRMGPWGTAMIPQPEARQIYLDDLVHNVGQSFLSMPMRCCKCHDHKFDPLPTRDYYGMYSAFATTQPAEMVAEFLPNENVSGFDEKRKLVEELLAYAKAERDRIVNKQESAAKKWYSDKNLPYKNEKQRKKDPEDKKPPRHVGLTPEETGIKKVREQDVWIWERRLERYRPMAQSVYNGQDDWKNSRKLRTPKTINKNWRPKNFILTGGALAAPGDSVTPGVLSATQWENGTASTSNGSELEANSKTEPAPWAINDGLNGRRLALAKWIADDKNPLTARSIVNRIWQYHFGKGIVETANNFGVKGSKPTHPELLDWLTNDFVQNGWKIKRLHRMIMASNVYRRSTKPSNPNHQLTADAENNLLASFPPRRLTAEEIRDSLLMITGELNREMGGVPIMPEINMEVALQPRMIQFSIAPAHQPSRTPSERNRRTIYAYRVRGQADPFLEIMNSPNPNESCETRDDASVSPQAFTLLNSDTMTDRSIAFALRLMHENPKDSTAWIRRAIQLAYGRLPTEKEQESLEDYLDEMRAYHQIHQPKKFEYPTHVTRSLVEEFTGKPFKFVEKLNVFENYQPDPKPWTVNADTRALADVCLLLFNSNEFIYLY